MAEDCKEQTAVLYRENESAIPIVDLFERNSIPYRIRNAELSFFTHRVVVDIQNILRFAYDTKNADIFELIYYKLTFYMNKQSALKACELSKEYNISIFSAIRTHMDIKPHIRKSIKALETHFNNMRSETPAKAINRIIQFMGYGDYMERTGLSNAKVYTMKVIASREDTIPDFLNRMEEIKNIIQNNACESV